MKFFTHTLNIGVAIIPFLFWSCSEEPISSDLTHSRLQLDTITVSNLQFENYLVYPNIGSNEKLFLGQKNNIDAPLTFIEMQTPYPVNYWGYLTDSNITVDSVRLFVYSNDSLLNEQSTPNLYFSPDSQFDENKSTYLDFDGFSLSSWENLGLPRIVKDIDDSLNTFINTSLVWSLDTLINVLYDTSDTNLARNFGLQFSDNSSNFIELISEEASYQVTDPMVKIYYHFEVSSADTTVYDTSFATIYSSKDLSIIKPDQSLIDSSKIGLSNGIGLRTRLNISFTTETIPEGALIKSANLIIPVDSTLSDSGYKIILDPIQIDSTFLLYPSFIFLSDPFISFGTPYRISNTINNKDYIVSVKEYFQNIILGNVKNIGFKIVSDTKNDPFQSAWFKLNEMGNRPHIKIIYASY